MTDHTHIIADCAAFAERLADFLERNLPDTARVAMEAHARSCDDCGPLLADLRNLRIDAANLPELTPSRDLWSGIEARIETPVVALRAGERVEKQPGLTRFTKTWVGLAAAALVGVTATATYQITKQSLAGATPAATVATLAAPAAPIATLSSPPDTAPVSKPTGKPASQPASRLASNAKPTADQTYDAEISRLRRVVEQRRGNLDSTTVVVLEKNLKIIDDAIAACRKALQQDPSSVYLNESLTDALDNKVQLLRAAAGIAARG